MASKISILKDIYLENRFKYNKLEAILFEEMRRIGLSGNREIYGKFALNIFKMFTPNFVTLTFYVIKNMNYRSSKFHTLPFNLRKNLKM
jgi:hypothetical protein